MECFDINKANKWVQALQFLTATELNCKFVNRQSAELVFFVTKNIDKQPLIIGLHSLMKHNIVQRVHNINANENKTTSEENILDEYKKVFKGKGCNTNFEYDIQLKDL